MWRVMSQKTWNKHVLKWFYCEAVKTGFYMARNGGHTAETTVAHLNTRLNDHFLSKISLKFSNCRFIRILSTLHNILSLNLAVSYHRKKNTFSKSKLWRLPAQQRVWPLTLHVVLRLVRLGENGCKHWKVTFIRTLTLTLTWTLSLTLTWTVNSDEWPKLKASVTSLYYFVVRRAANSPAVFSYFLWMFIEVLSAVMWSNSYK